jgi:hypothetical protein
MEKNKLLDDLKRHEGFVPHVYTLRFFLYG